jgi:hypothetical protein
VIPPENNFILSLYMVFPKRKDRKIKKRDWMNLSSGYVLAIGGK